METIKIKYFDNEIDKVEKISKGDLIDLRSAETVELKKGEFHLIPLGVGMKLPNGYKANIYPRSSTYKNFGIILANSVGQVDASYCGENDQWMFPAIALRDTTINKNDRICQFEIQRIQPEIEFEEVEHLDEVSRGGIGSTERRDMENKILSQQDLYDVLPFGKTKVLQLIKSGELPLVKVGKDYITTFNLLEEWIKNHIGEEIYY